MSTKRALTVCLPALSFEVAEQPVEGLLIRVVLFPLAKVADMALAGG
jgi:hypothetical protein